MVATLMEISHPGVWGHGGHLESAARTYRHEKTNLIQKKKNQATSLVSRSFRSTLPPLSCMILLSFITRCDGFFFFRVLAVSITGCCSIVPTFFGIIIGLVSPQSYAVHVRSCNVRVKG